MSKHNASILLSVFSLLFASAWMRPAAKAEHGFTPRQTPILVGPGPSPEQEARENAFWRPIYREVQKSEKLLDQNDLTGAQQAAGKALWMAGSHQGKLAEELAPVYLRAGQYGKVAALFNANPFHAMSLNAAISYLKTGRLAKARKCWRESQMMPYHRDFVPYLPGLSSAKAFEATIFLCRGITDVDQNHPMNALWAVRHALHLVPRNPLALWYYAEALAATGKSEEARHFFQAAVARDHCLVARRAREGMARLDHVGGPRL